MIRLIDIEKELRSVKTEYKPDEQLRRRTRFLVKKEIWEKKERKASFRKAAFVYSPAVAVLLVLVLCLSMFTAVPAKAASYYTIDIDQSITVAVDQNNVVISVSFEDGKAAPLLEGLDIKGMQFEDALKTVVHVAVQNDYLKENGHVLVAHFGDGEGITQDDINTIVNEQLPADNVSTVALNGSRDDYDNAKKSGKNAGMELLLTSADAAGIKEKDPEKVITIMSDKQKNEKGKPGKDKDEDKNQVNDKNEDKSKETRDRNNNRDLDD